MNLNPIGTDNKFQADGYTSTGQDGSSVASVVYRPAWKGNNWCYTGLYWKDVAHTIQTYDYVTGHKFVLDGYFFGHIESVKFTSIRLVSENWKTGADHPPT